MPNRVLQSGTWCLAISLFLSGTSAAQTQAHRRKLTTDIKEIVLENRLLSRKFALDKGWLRTARFANLLTGENIATNSPEFEIQLENEPALSSDDFVAEYYTHVNLAGEVKRTLFTLTEKRQRLQAELEYTLGPNDFFIRKRVRLHSLQRNLPRLLVLSVEALKIGNLRTAWPFSFPTTQPGPSEGAARRASNDSFGQPVFLNDSFFWGMEYPAGSNQLLDGVVRCSEHPGSPIASSGFESHGVVAGISPRGEIADWFQRYVDTFRLPTRPFTILRIRDERSNNVSLAQLLGQKMEAVPNPGRPDKPFVDAFVLDAGWWLKSSSRPADTLLEDLGATREILKSRGIGLGLYFPFSDSRSGKEDSQSGGARTTKSTSAGKSELTAGCLPDPKFKEALKARLRELHQGKALRFVRHDLGDALCQSAFQGKAVEASIAHEAATDVVIELLRLERSLDADLYISLVGRELPSPWWLQYANDVGPGDFSGGYSRLDLLSRPRDWQIQHEAVLFQEYVKGEHFQFPLSRLTASVLEQVIGAPIREPEASWADAVTEYLGRGQDLTQLGFDPAQLHAGDWEILRRGLQWKASRQPVFHRGSIIGGDLEKGEAYGYLHWNANQAIAVLRNPSPSPRETSFHLPKSLRGSLRILQTYPRCRVESQLLKAGDIVNTFLEGLETRVLEVSSEGTWNSALPQDADFLVSSKATDSDDSEIALQVFPETTEIQFSQPQSVVGLQLAQRPIPLDSSGKAQLPDDSETRKFVEAQKSLAEKKAEVGVYAKRGVQLTLPEWSGVRSNLSVWLLQPEGERANFPLYVTLDRRQVNLGERQSFTPPAETRKWNFYSLPLKFNRQVLLDWAIKDVKDVSLYLWWEIEAPRPALEVRYRHTSGKAREILPPLLSSPGGGDYVVRIPLEAEKPGGARPTPLIQQ